MGPPATPPHPHPVGALGDFGKYFCNTFIFGRPCVVTGRALSNKPLVSGSTIAIKTKFPHQTLIYIQPENFFSFFGSPVLYCRSVWYRYMICPEPNNVAGLAGIFYVNFNVGRICRTQSSKNNKK